MKNIKIGKDVIESLTLGMYEDSRFIFREYVQNSADQIDKAIEQNILNDRDEGNIFITIDADSKIIEFEDNATGIKSIEFESILTNIAQSNKDRGKDKGFRGIGRLGGLGYCDKLIFESSYFGENTKNIMEWDAKLLKEIINDRSQKEEASEVINRITKRNQESEDVNKHYFKVILQNVTNKELLSINEIREYLSLVAPVPFEGHFIFKSKITEELSKFNLLVDEYKIFINTEQLYKAYKTVIKDNNGKNKDDIFDIKFKIIFYEEIPIAFIWYGISKAIEQISPKYNIARGFRLRKGNIQIGSEYTLRKFHRDQRFHFYFIGEVHAFSPELIPNARRDYFLENKVCKDFESQLKHFFSDELHGITYAASSINSANRKIEQFEQVKKTFEETSQKGFTSSEEKEKLEKQLQESKGKAEEAKKDLNKFKNKYKEHDVLNKIYAKVVTTEDVKIENTQIDEEENNNGKTKFRTDNLSRLDKSQRKLISKIYKVIDDKLTPDLAENIKYWIEQEFK